MDRGGEDIVTLEGYLLELSETLSIIIIRIFGSWQIDAKEKNKGEH